MSIFRLSLSLTVLAACTLALPAHADYGQMRLDGIGLLLAFGLSVAYGLVIDVALIARLFRHRTVLSVGLVATAAVFAFFLIQVASPTERAGFFKGAPGGAPLVVLVLTSAVFLPFIAIAPIAQFRWMRAGQRWPRWMSAWIALQVALVPAFVILATADEKFWQRDYAAGYAVGRDVSAGGFSAIQERAERQPERIWGTGWTHRWRQAPPSGYLARRSGWMSGLARGVDASTPIASDAPLEESDRMALRSMLEGPFVGYAVPNIHAKLIWDALEPGSFATQLAPYGLNEPGVVSEEVIPLLVERLERSGAARVCPGGQMMEADRALLQELVLAKVRIYDAAKTREQVAEREQKKREAEMAQAPAPYRLVWNAANALGNAYGSKPAKLPDWEAYSGRVERLCRGPA